MSGYLALVIICALLVGDSIICNVLNTRRTKFLAPGNDSRKAP